MSEEAEAKAEATAAAAAKAAAKVTAAAAKEAWLAQRDAPTWGRAAADAAADLATAKSAAAEASRGKMLRAESPRTAEQMLESRSPQGYLSPKRHMPPPKPPLGAMSADSVSVSTTRQLPIVFIVTT